MKVFKILLATVFGAILSSFAFSQHGDLHKVSKTKLQAVLAKCQPVDKKLVQGVDYWVTPDLRFVVVKPTAKDGSQTIDYYLLANGERAYHELFDKFGLKEGHMYGRSSGHAIELVVKRDGDGRRYFTSRVEGHSSFDIAGPEETPQLWEHPVTAPPHP